MFAFTSLLFADGLAGFLSSPLGQLMPFVLMIAVFYLLVLRPMSNQENERKQRLAELKRGDRIVLTGGILGRVSRIEDDILIVEIADKVKIRVLKKDVADLEENALSKAKEERGEDDKGDKKSKGDDKKSGKNAKAG